MQAYRMLADWAKSHDLTHFTSLDVIAEVVKDASDAPTFTSQEDLALLRDHVAGLVRGRKVNEARAAMEVMTTMANRSDTSLLVEGLRGHHPYLLNEVAFALLKAIKEQCGRGGQWDGRIATPLQGFIDEYVV